MKNSRLLATLIAVLSLSLFAAACGDDEDKGGESATEPTTEESASAVTLTADEYTFDLSSTPTAKTKKVTFKNEGEQFHVMIFARINEGFTLDEAFQKEGKGGSATVFGQTQAQPGKTATVQLTKPLTPGSYAVFCPLPSPKGPHYKRGQLEEFEIQ